MKAVRIILSTGSTVMCYLSIPSDKKYGIAFAGSESCNFANIIDTENFDDSMNEWIKQNKDFDCIENIESIEVL